MSVGTSVDFRTSYETVAAGVSDQVIGSEGKAGDVLQRIICSVTALATSDVSIKDGAGSAIPVLPINTPLGVHSVELGVQCVTNWKISTSAGVTVLAVGRFR